MGRKPLGANAFGECTGCAAKSLLPSLIAKSRSKAHAVSWFMAEANIDSIVGLEATEARRDSASRTRRGAASGLERRNCDNVFMLRPVASSNSAG
jgi:hypothetical protein